MIQSTWDQIEQIKETTYNDFVNTYVVDEEGHGVSIENKPKVTNLDGVSYTNIENHGLTEYNVEDPKNLIPKVQE